MRIPIILAIITFSIVSIKLSYAVETFDVTKYPGKLDITIDGNLADWNSLNAAPSAITNVNPNRIKKSTFKSVDPQNADDLSASLRCVADEYNLYLGVEVKDDVLLLGVGPYGDIAVDVLFYWQDGMGMLLHVDADYQGNTLIEGFDFITESLNPHAQSQYEYSYPFLMEALGIKAKILIGEKGYTLEEGIPFMALEAFGWNSTEKLGMTVRVFDDDGDEEAYNCFDTSIDWCDYEHNRFKELIFKAQDTTQVGTVQNAKAEVIGDRNLQLQIGIPNGAANHFLPECFGPVKEALQHTWKNEWAQAEAKLLPFAKLDWIKPMLGQIQLREGKADEGISTLTDVIENIDDIAVATMAAQQKAMYFRKIGDFENACSAIKSMENKSAEGAKRLLATKLTIMALLADKYLEEGKLDQAENQYRDLLKNAGKDPKLINWANRGLEHVDWKRMLKGGK
jgi:tetratricopeptide (TPR) repeat protein